MVESIGNLYVVATPIGNLADLSDRAKHTLSTVDWIAAEDTRHSLGLLNSINVSSKLISYHQHNEQARTQELIEKLKAGQSGALISDAGTPLISDPGFTLIQAAHLNNVTVLPIPGCSAVMAALSVCGLPVDKFYFEGFLPAKSAARKKRITELDNLNCTFVLFESPHRIKNMLEDMVEILQGDRQAFIGRELTKKFEMARLSYLQEILTSVSNELIPCKGEFVLVVQGKEQTALSEAEQKMQSVLDILLAAVPLKQAVQLAMQLTGLPRNKLYECATKRLAKKVN